MPDSSPPEVNDWADAALRSIREAGVAITPHSFAVWYEYHRGGIPELNRILDVLSSNKTRLDEETVAKLYNRFVGSPQAYLSLRDVSDRLQHTIADALAVLHTAGEDAGRFGIAVRETSEQLAAPDASITDLVRTLLGEAQEAVGRMQRVEGELARNAELMKSLERTLDESRREALTDSLTGLPNRRHFEETMHARAGDAMNEGSDLTLMLVDIDHFKRINAQWGHAVGDRVLQLVANTLRGALRQSDFPARYGGEEFAVLLPGCTCDAAAAIGNRLREAFARHRVVVRESRKPIGTVTLSIGVASYLPGEKLEHWLRRGELALYAAKQNGRNRVEEAEPTLAD